MTIIFLKDVLDKRAELTRYRHDLERLNSKLEYIRREIALTEKIIKMVEKEEIIELDKVVRSRRTEL